ncbi:MAG: hypothetical protein KGN84_04785, partial [Acidobacteriota bacterium]|nr:hypothetical protein [Acidobacteriota bacterium]
MDHTKLTVKSQEAIAASQELARKRGNPEIYPEHLLLSLLEQDLWASWRERLRPHAEEELAKRPAMQGAPNLQRIAHLMGHE